MAVVINEFEVVTEPGTPPAEPTTERKPEAAAFSAQEVERILRYEYERALRVWAH